MHSFVTINSYFYKFSHVVHLVFTFLRLESLELVASVTLLGRLPENFFGSLTM